MEFILFRRNSGNNESKLMCPFQPFGGICPPPQTNDNLKCLEFFGLEVVQRYLSVSLCELMLVLRYTAGPDQHMELYLLQQLPNFLGNQTEKQSRVNGLMISRTRRYVLLKTNPMFLW